MKELATYDLEAPRTHNIWIVLKQLIDDNKLDKEIENYLLENKLFFADLTFYYISERYPSYKENLVSRLNKEAAKDLLSKAKGVFECLISQYK